MIRVEHGDCLEVIPRLVEEGVQVDAVCCDPPYDFTAVKRGSTPGSVAASKDVFASVKSGGFMGMAWDGTGVAFRPDTWATVATILRPGGFLLAFGGTRTQHRMVCAIEDAGFVIQDAILWLHGQGFPKHQSHLKPAVEPICVAYKPGGARTLQVDECRIPTGDSLGGGDQSPNTKTKVEGWDRPWMRDGDAKAAHAERVNANVEKAEALGRWPANVIHDGSDEVMEAFAAFGDHKAGAAVSGKEPSAPFGENVYGDMNGRVPFHSFADNGSVSRYFYCSKADAQDRWGSRHPTVKPIGLLKWLVPLVTPIGGTVLDCFAGSGTTGVAALATGRNAILIEREAEYIGDIRERLAFYEGNGRHSVAARNRNRRETAGTLI